MVATVFLLFSVSLVPCYAEATDTGSPLYLYISYPTISSPLLYSVAYPVPWNKFEIGHTFTDFSGGASGYADTAFGVESSVFKFNATTGRPDCYLNGELVEKEIRSLEVSNHVSPIAAVPFVREALVEQQQKMGEDKGIVMDGRDIGTTVFPNAELKIFVTASSQVRAQRRFDELKEKGMPADFDAILKNVEERDYIDTHRETSPLRKADDAITLDNSNMTIPEQKAWLMEQYQKAIAE